MQTFLPYPDYALSAESLDTLRLGKQRVEVLQILNVLHEISGGWHNHPAVRMWRGHEVTLTMYGEAICDEWIKRGYRDTVKAQIAQHFQWATAGDYTLERPRWFGDEEFHRAHQSNLLRKAEQYMLHHSDEPHEAHGKCNGVVAHKPHARCEPLKYWEWYAPRFPGVPRDLPYIWPVPA